MQVNVVDARVRHTRRFHSSRPKKKKKFLFLPFFLPRRFLPPFLFLLLASFPPSFSSNLLFALSFTSRASRLSSLPSFPSITDYRSRFRNYARMRNFSMIQRLKPISYNSLPCHLSFFFFFTIRQFF